MYNRFRNRILKHSHNEYSKQGRSTLLFFVVLFGLILIFNITKIITWVALIGIALFACYMAFAGFIELFGIKDYQIDRWWNKRKNFIINLVK